MCEVLDRVFDKGKKESIKIFVARLRKIKQSDEDIVKAIMEDFNISEEEARQYVFAD